jgi:hypothetical protein
VPSLGVTRAHWPSDSSRRPSANHGSLAGWAEGAPALGAAGTLVPLTLAVDVRSFKQSLSLAGTIPVRGCGVGKSAVPERPQPRVTFQVEGVPVPVRGALLSRAFDRPEVLLTSRPTTCRVRGTAVGLPADVVARVIIRDEGRADLWLEGALLPQKIGVWSPGGQARVAGEPDANGEVDVTLTFASLQSNPKVLLAGRVRALRCR